MSAIWKLNFAHLTPVQFSTDWLLLEEDQKDFVPKGKKTKREEDNKTEKKKPKLREYVCYGKELLIFQ